MMQQARDFYDGMTVEEQIKFVQRKLNGANQYTGAIDGSTSSELTSAIGRFQGENGLIADGRINFDLYYALLDNDVAPTPDMSAREKPLMSAATMPMGVTISSDKGGRYQVSDVLMANVQTTADGFLYCYYKDVSGSIARIFPNRFKPNPFIKANSPMSLPSETSPFKIRFDKAGREQVTCYASNRDLALPPNVKGADLTPLQVSSMDEIANAFRKSNPSLAEAKLDIAIH
jgi:peptidoglycan hydrolase-like protein with peptidoglycan-binding domain